MKACILFVLAFAGVAAQASDAVILKSLRCENANIKTLVRVTQSSGGSVGLVEWHTKNKTTGEVTKNLGYLFSENGLQSFSSTDIDSAVEVDGTTVTISNGTSTEVIHCP